MSHRLAASVLGGLLLAACAGPAEQATPAPTPTLVRYGPALVQVENSPDARPLSGLQQADLVFEYLTEGGITRMTALYFNPSGGQKIEPVRSARLITLRLQKAYQGMIAYSGASNHVLGLIYSQHVPGITEGSDGGAYFSRDHGRFAPHNLTTTPDQLAQAVHRYAPHITYRLPAAGQPAASPAPALASRIAFNQTPSHHVAYEYSQAGGAYAYRADGSPLIDTDTGQAIQVVNVVLLQVAHHGMGYTEDVMGAEGIDFDLQGTGPADVYSEGHHYKATWDLTDPGQPLRLLGPDLKPLLLPKGLTWLHLIDPGTPVAIS